MTAVSENIKLSQLRALIAVSERGNFSEAALHLNISQSAISHAIATLEEELGVVLLARGRHGATTTPIGEQVIARARQIMELLEGMVHEVQLQRGLQGGRLRIASFRSAATHLIPPVIARFRERFSEITITITEHDDYADVEQDLRLGRADLGFTHLPCSGELETWEILRDEYVVLLPASSHVISPKNKRGLTWEELARYPLILESDGTGCSLLVRNHLKKYGQSFHIAYEVKEDSTVVGMVAQGLGAAILPRLAAEPIPQGIRIYSLPDKLERVIGVAVLANALHVPAVYAFLDALKGVGLFAGNTSTVSVA
ncbi:MAG: LysR family transcriptional regulator [Cyanobacteriota bacterium]|nr:LysR family transcriptional regulator [Cyanobacteriota bacterium]